MRIQTLIRALLVATGLFALSASADAHWDVGISVGFAPPPLPVYEQPACPGIGYLWAPGYWAYDAENDGGYYWVPGTWALAPRPGLLWTPGYWGAEGISFAWHTGYWDLSVGFYGGIDYGFGYFGSGYAGGYWRDGDFFYNRAVNNVTNVSVTNVYNNTVYNNTVVNNRGFQQRVSYNGGPAGTRARPSGAELVAARAPHIGATSDQRRHETAARSMPDLRLAANHGVPPVAATTRPAEFTGHGLATARAGMPALTGRGGADARSAALPPRSESLARPGPAPVNGGRSAVAPSRETTGRPRADRPAWADRTTSPTAAARTAPAPVARARDAGQQRAATPYEYRPGARAGYAAPLQSRQDTHASAPASARSSYPTASAPAPRYSAPRYSAPPRPAPSYPAATREPARSSYTARANTPREFTRPPPRPAAAAAAPRPSYRPPDNRARDQHEPARGQSVGR